MGHISGAPGSRGIPTFALLDQIVTVLGGTKLSFWPFLNDTGGTTHPYGSGNDGLLLATNASTLELVFDPALHVGGVHSYHNDSASANLAAADSDAFSFTDGANDDAAFSVGMWVLMEEALGNARGLLSKYDAGITLREWTFGFSATGKLTMELYDESTDDTEIATSTGTALTPFAWQFVTMTYDGGETAPVINLYLNATSVHDGTSVETAVGGGYVGMENTNVSMLLGARGSPGGVSVVFQGRIALPFVTGKELTAAETTTVYNLGRKLLGLAN